MEKEVIGIKINIKKHLIIWTLITIYLSILDPVPGNLLVQVPVTFLILLNYALVFYIVSRYVFPKFWSVNFFLVVLFVLVIFLAFTAIDYLNLYHLMPYLGGESLYSDVSIGKLISRTLFSFTLVFGPAVGYYFSNLSIVKIKEQNDREKLLLIRELNFLKNQFNSHITFNFLNYCYSNIHQLSEKTADAIELFSNMLRYSLKIRPDEKVLLVDEIEYLNNFIKLQKLLTTQIFVNFNFEGDLKNKVILSRILITFVENAFKHGQINSSSYPITILLRGDSGGVTLSVSNKKNSKKQFTSTGVGHENVMQVLQLYYPNKYEFKIDQDIENYACELTLKLDS